MSTDADNYFAHMGLEVDDEIKHYGRKGMKWGVRKDDPSGGVGSRWTDDQKKKAVAVGTIALVAAVGVGAIYARASMHSIPSTASLRAMNESTMSAGKKAAESVLNAKGGAKVPTMPANLRKFIADSPARLLSDQKGWSEALGQSLNNVQKGDAAFIADYIKNYAPKAIGN